MFTKRFVCSFDLEAEYEIGGAIYRVRSGMHLSLTSGDWRENVRARIGTVMYEHHPHFCKFPPPEVMALFPGMVGARYSEETVARGSEGGVWMPEYNGPAPEVVQPFGPDTLMWGPWARACVARTYEIRAEYLAPHKGA
jgi:hypothetical protein